MCLADTTLDVRDIPLAERHPGSHDAFVDPESGEALSPIDYHEPGPLFYEMRADVETFGADRNTVDHRGPEEYVATLLGQ